MRPLVELSETILPALQLNSAKWGFEDNVYHLDNGVLGGTMTYAGRIGGAWISLLGLLGECNIEASDLISYFSIEEVSD